MAAYLPSSARGTRWCREQAAVPGGQYLDGAPLTPDSILNRDPKASDNPSDNDSSQPQTETDVFRRRNPSDLRYPDQTRHYQTKPA